MKATTVAAILAWPVWTAVGLVVVRHAISLTVKVGQLRPKSWAILFYGLSVSFLAAAVLQAWDIAMAVIDSKATVFESSAKMGLLVYYGMYAAIKAESLNREGD